jgi:hypothetical protein
MATDHRGRKVHAGKRTNDEMMSMPTPGTALRYFTPEEQENTVVLTDHGAYTVGGYTERFGNSILEPRPVKWDFDKDEIGDSPKPQKPKGVPKKKEATTEEQRSNRDLFW